MPFNPSPLASALRSLIRAPQACALLLPVGLLGCGGGGGGGGDSDQSTALSNDEATDVMAQRLTNVTQGTDAEVGFSPLSTVTCDNLGIYTDDGVDYRVCQIYAAEGEEGIPNFSPDAVDLVSRVPAGDADEVLASADEDLQGAEWTPVLKSGPVDFGEFETGTAINGEFSVRSAAPAQLGGSCDIVDDQGNTDATANLTNQSTDGRVATLGFSDPGGFGLASGQYQLDCTFTWSGATKEIDDAGVLDVAPIAHEGGGGCTGSSCP